MKDKFKQARRFKKFMTMVWTDITDIYEAINPRPSDLYKLCKKNRVGYFAQETVAPVAKIFCSGKTP